jgi:hypothetical protein
MREKVKSLLTTASRDVIMLDALHQWASAPTGYTAVHRGFPPDHTLIMSNLMVRYDLSPDAAERIYERLQIEVKASGFSFSDGYLEAEPAIKKYFAETALLRRETEMRLSVAEEKDQRIAWLFCREKENFAVWPHSRDHHIYHEKMKRFLALLNATFGISAEEDEVLHALIRLGFINELQWVHVSASHEGARRENELVFPAYLHDTAARIDDHVHLPDPPDSLVYLNDLFYQGRGEALMSLEEILEKGWAMQNEIGEGVSLHPGIVGRRAGVLAVSARLHQQVYADLRMRKEAVSAGTVERVRQALDLICSPSSLLSCKEIDSIGGMKIWHITPESEPSGEPETYIILTPWITRNGMERLKGITAPACIILITTMLRVTRVEEMYAEVFSKDLRHERIQSWILIEYASSGVNGKVFLETPAFYEKMMAFLNAPISPPVLSEERTSHLSVFLGTSTTGGSVSWSPGALQNGHFIIIGGAGAGKTETIRCIAAELEKKQFPVLMIDFHGDMATDTDALQTYQIREEAGYYFNPLELDPAFGDITPLRATSDFVDAMYINFPSLGIQQKEQLKRLIREAYRRAGIRAEKSTWLRELDFMELEEALMTSDNRTAQTLRAYLDDIFEYQLFSGTQKISMHEILTGVGITRLDLRALPESLRFLFADLFLRKMYYSLQAMGEIPWHHATDPERFRLFVIVDEAKLLASEKQGIKAVLNKYTSELRKFGVGLILASQMPSHFPQEILANIEAKLCMRAQNQEQARRNSKYFGVPADEVLKLRQGEGILMVGNEKVRVKITPTWERVDRTREKERT